MEVQVPILHLEIAGDMNVMETDVHSPMQHSQFTW